MNNKVEAYSNCHPEYYAIKVGHYESGENPENFVVHDDLLCVYCKQVVKNPILR